MSYKAGIVKAIQELGDRTGSSSIAIKKHMQAHHPKDKTWQNATFLSSLKTGVANGDLVQNKNSYKISAEYKKKLAKVEKPKKAAAPKKKSVKTAVAKTTTATKKKTTTAASSKPKAKKSVAKKVTKVKTAVKPKASKAKKPAATKKATKPKESKATESEVKE